MLKRSHFLVLQHNFNYAFIAPKTKTHGKYVIKPDIWSILSPNVGRTRLEKHSPIYNSDQWYTNILGIASYPWYRYNCVTFYFHALTSKFTLK